MLTHVFQDPTKDKNKYDTGVYVDRNESNKGVNIEVAS